MKLTPIDFIKDLSQNKKDILDESVESQYKPYLINRYLSMDPTTAMYANDMNLRHHICKRMQYDYYLSAIKKQSRFFKYAKHTKIEDIEFVKEYFGYNYTKAKDALSLISSEEMEYIKTKLKKGGRSAA